ncbi:hypothetical protein ACKKBF_B01295 [Auxenochlorella protothecoides x Auxenochlorella symbiontica]
MAVADDSPSDVARILISSQRSPMTYLSTAKRHLQQHGSVHITALGTALSSLVTLSEVLKNSKLVDEVKLTTCLEHFKDEFSDRQKPKMDIMLTKSAAFDKIMAEEAKKQNDHAGADPQ